MKRIILSIATIVMCSCASERYTIDMYFEEFESIKADTTTYEMDESEALLEVLANAGFDIDQQKIAYDVIERFPNSISERDIIAILEAFNGSVKSTINYLTEYNGEEVDWAW